MPFFSFTLQVHRVSSAFRSEKQIFSLFTIGVIKSLCSEHNRPDEARYSLLDFLFDTQNLIKSQSKTTVMITKAYGA